MLVQFSTLPSLQVQKNLRNAGCNLHCYIPGNAYLATIKNGFDFSQAGQFEIISINTIPLLYKKDRALANFKESANKENQQLIAVSYYSSVNKTEVITELQKIGALVEPTKYVDSRCGFCSG